MDRVFAQITNPALPSALGSGGKGSGGSIVGGIISGIVGVFIVIAFILSLFQVITGGIQWAASGDDKSGLEAARNKITHGIVGLIIVAAAWAIFTLVGNFLGLDIKNLTIPSVTP